jgi:hypothetical protein
MGKSVVDASFGHSAKIGVCARERSYGEVRGARYRAADAVRSVCGHKLRFAYLFQIEPNCQLMMIANALGAAESTTRDFLES